jgi:hypothetical protein
MDIFAGWMPKDWITLGTGVVALFFSLLSYRQKTLETTNALRRQLTDVLEKLADLKFEIASYKSLPEAKKTELPEDYVIFKNEQRRFFSNQAVHVAEQISPLVSRFENLLIADAASAVDDIEHAEIFYARATKREWWPFWRAGNIERGIALRTLAALLFGENRSNGTKAMQRALLEFKGKNDRCRLYRARCYEIWAELEAALRRHPHPRD